MENIINFAAESESVISTKSSIDTIRNHVLEFIKKTNPYMYNYAERFAKLCPEITPDVSIYDRMQMSCEMDYRLLKRKDVLELYNQALLDEIEMNKRDDNAPRIRFTDLSEFSDDGGIISEEKIQKKKDDRMEILLSALSGDIAAAEVFESWGEESGGTFLAKIKKEQIEKLNALVSGFEDAGALIITTPYPDRSCSSADLIVEFADRFLMMDNPVVKNAFNIADSVAFSCERGILRLAFSINNIWAI